MIDTTPEPITPEALEAAPAGSIIRTAAGTTVAVKTTDADGTPWHAPALTRAQGDDLWHSADSLVRELEATDELVAPPAPVSTEPEPIDLSPLTTAIAWAERDAEASVAILESMTLDAIRELTVELAVGETIAHEREREAEVQTAKAREARRLVGERLLGLVPTQSGGAFVLVREGDAEHPIYGGMRVTSDRPSCSRHLVSGCTACR